jgi:prepilin-type N-terminal cleavage/methylation domain-containing protein
MKRANKGFTLVELIIVIAILAIIMLIAIPNFSGIQRRMQVRADKATAAQIGKAVRVWFTDYTTDPTLSILDTSGTATVDGTTHKATAAGTTVPSHLAVYGTGDGQTVVPNRYEDLDGIEGYISIGQNPSSLADSTNKNVDTQAYGVILTGAYNDATSKIAVVIYAPGHTSDDLKQLDSVASASYDGSKAAVAYLEP